MEIKILLISFLITKIEIYNKIFELDLLKILLKLLLILMDE